MSVSPESAVMNDLKKATYYDVSTNRELTEKVNLPLHDVKHVEGG